MSLSVKNMLGGGKPNAPYAWAKYEYEVIPPIDAVNPTFEMSSSNYTVTITESTVDLTLIGDNWREFFDGFKYNSGDYPKFQNDSDLLRIYASSSTASRVTAFTATSPTTGTLTLQDSWSKSSTLCKFIGTKHIKDEESKVGSFIEYITDKSPIKYPNGEVHTDGYFYRYAPEGLYVWKKYNYAFAEKSTSGIVANTFITTEAQNKSIKYYYSSSYSYDDNTGMFVLENPTSGTVPYEAGVSPPANVYITVFSPSSEIMIKTSSTSGKSTLYNVSAGVYFHIANANYPYTLFESETILSFIDYIVSDKETAYPDGGEKGGYWYEKVGEGLTPEMFGCTQMAVDTFTLTSRTSASKYTISHSLGTEPKYFIIIGDYDDSNSTYDIYSVMGANHNLSSIVYYANICYWANSSFENSYVTISPISSVGFKVDNVNYKFKANAKYTVITLA